MASIYEQAQGFRAALIQRDAAAINVLTDEYREVYSRLLRSLTALNNQIREAQQQGQTVSRAWINQQWRYQSFLRDLDREFQAYAGNVGRVVEARRFFEAQQAAADAGAVIGSVNGSFNRLPVNALRNIVSNLQVTSPLRKLLDNFGPVASQKVQATLRDAIALGWNPRKSARGVRDALGVPLNRALTICRTESNRAYRMATHDSYNSSEVVTGYYWLSSKSSRTCLACIALDGKFFPKNKPQPCHVNCRCTSVAAIEGVPPSKRESAGAWFERQSDEVKKTMMSGIAYSEYKSGNIQLSDFIGHANSRKWGPVTYERSVREILGQ